jgi:ABC-type bacteriocin/lantibiotic exporter with double-glycine peptidase domain
MNVSKSWWQLQNVMRLLRPYRRFLVESVLTGLLISLLSVPGPWLTKILIDDVFTGGEYSLLYFVVILMLAFALFQAVMGFLREFFMANVSMRMTGDIQMRFLDHLQKMSFRFYDLSETGEIASRFSDVSGSLGSSLAILNTVAFNFVQIVFFPLVMLYVSWKLTLIALIVLPFEVLVFVVFNKFIAKYTRLATEMNADLNARVIETLEGIKTVQSLGLESTMQTTARNKIFHVLNLQAKLTAYFQASVLLQNVLKAAGTFLYTLFGWRYILGGEISLGVFLAFANYVGYFYGPVFELLGMNRQIQAAFTHTNRFLEIYDMKPDIADGFHTVRPERITGDIRFQNVSFSYDGRGTVLDSLDLAIPRGAVVALVGRSGVGKTTIANLIARFYEPTAGSVLLDGHDIREVPLELLRSNIGYVMQEPFLFNGSIKDNIMIGLEADAKTFQQAAAAAYVDEFARRLPDGYNTLVGQKGVKLSQGQKQRIALARVVLRKAPILLLDEPTSSLDIESEEYIQKAMENVFTDRTAVIIAHRLSTIKNADVILVLENGRIAESGNHEELLAAQGYYYTMYMKMARI